MVLAGRNHHSLASPGLLRPALPLHQQGAQRPVAVLSEGVVSRLVSGVVLYCP